MNSKSTLKYYAFFDVDGTIITLNSLMGFLRYYYESTAFLKIVGTMKFMFAKCRIQLYRHMGKDRNFLNRFYYKFYKNHPVSKVKEYGKEWFFKLDQDHAALYRKAVIDELCEHQDKGAEIVFVSGSFPDCLQPLADKFGVKHILATTLEQRGAVYTGNILDPQTIGDGKRVAMEAFLQENDVQASDCYAYGDHISDIPMLAVVGHPVALVGDASLTDHAKNKGWRVMESV